MTYLPLVQILLILSPSAVPILISQSAPLLKIIAISYPTPTLTLCSIVPSLFLQTPSQLNRTSITMEYAAEIANSNYTSGIIVRKWRVGASDTPVICCSYEVRCQGNWMNCHVQDSRNGDLARCKRFPVLLLCYIAKFPFRKTSHSLE